MTHPLIEGLRPLTRRVRTVDTALRRNGEQSWTDEPLTDERLAAHLGGGSARGVCPIQRGGTTTMVGLLDFDSHKGEASWSEMSFVVGCVLDVMTLAHGASPVVFRSTGGKGAHLYVVWAEPQDAYSVRMWLRGVLAACGLRDGASGVRERAVEVFPKQDHVPVTVMRKGKPAPGYGSQFTLPLAGQSELLEMDDLSGLLLVDPDGRDPSKLVDVWQDSPPVVVVSKPVREATAVRNDDVSETFALLESALDAITTAVNVGAIDMPRDRWRNCLFGIHEATNGDEVGRDLAHAWSRSIPDYDTDAVDKVWDSAEPGKPGAAGAGSVFHLAGDKAVGWVNPTHAQPNADAFAVVVAEPLPEGVEEPPPYQRERSGLIKSDVTNAAMAVRRPDQCGMRIAHDTFRDELTCAPRGTSFWKAMNDADMVRLRMALERLRFKSVTKELVREAAILVADENQHDTAQVWLASIEPCWDGMRRCEFFLRDCLGTEDTPYTRAVSLYIWTALAGRIITPGVKADMVPVFKGPGGILKSTILQAMVPDPLFYIEIDLSKPEAELARLMRGALVGEISELRGLHTRDNETIKAFTSRQHEKWVPKFKEFATTFARRCIFFGTTNKSDILADETGNRRWLPVLVTMADVERLKRDLEQYWAEGAAIYRGAVPPHAGEPLRPGVQWQDAERLAEAEHGAFEISDSWEEPALRWLDSPDPFAADNPGSGQADAPRGDSAFTMAEFMSGALTLTVKEQTQQIQKRCGVVLRRLGYDRRNLRGPDGKQSTRWVKLKC